MLSTKMQSTCEVERIDAYQQLSNMLRMCCLRRTKQTMLDGQPIVDLPPRFVFVFLCLGSVVVWQL